MRTVPPISSRDLPLSYGRATSACSVIRHWLSALWGTAAPPSAIEQVCSLAQLTLVGLAVVILLVCGRNAHAQEIDTIYGWMNEGSDPQAGLVQASDGYFYGTTYYGGVKIGGTIFRISAEGEYSVLHFFTGRDIDDPPGTGGTEGDDGRHSASRLIQGRDGNLYGTTVSGGSNGKGTIFRISPTGEYSILHSLDGTDGVAPYGGVTQGSDGNFYGITSYGGANGNGTVFRISASGEYSVLYSLPEIAGSGSEAVLVEGDDGYFYGSTPYGGASGNGMIFRISSSRDFAILHSFNGADGSIPKSGVIKGRDGYFYGTTNSGGANKQGVIFRISAAGEYLVLHSFAGTDGSNPESGMLQARDGYFYGTTPYGGVDDSGLVFRISAEGEYSVIHSFSQGPYQIKSHYCSELVQGRDGNLYGTSLANASKGTIFRISITGEEDAVLYSFRPGYYIPGTVSGVVKGSDGNFYGTTSYGGARGYGSVFRISKAGEYTTIHSFSDTDGSSPHAELMQGGEGCFYGTTYFGGANDKGTIFRISKEGEFTVLHSFADTDGAYPFARIIEGSDGHLYGTTVSGGANSKGTIFRISKLGEYVILHSFDGAYGSHPVAGLLQGSDGYFYGSVNSGGIDQSGVIFRISTAGEYTVLHFFTGADGKYCEAEMVQGGDGYFYGSTSYGGANNNGTVFRINASGEYAVIHSFSGIDGSSPHAGLVQGSDDRFYGTTEFGGAGGYGTIFRISAAGNYSVLHSFERTGGQYPRTTPIIESDGSLWGTTSRESTYAAGILYRLPLESVTPPPVTLPADKVTYSSGILHARVAPRNGAMVQFEYSTDPTLVASVSTDLVPLPIGSNAVVISAQLSGLEPGMTYYYKARVRRADGAVQLGEILSFTTGLAEPQTTVLATKGAAVPGAGIPGSGIPSGATWKHFSVPALGGNAQLAFGASLKLSGGVSLTGIFAGDSAAPVLMVKMGDAAVGLPQGSVFSSFRDPLFNSEGELAFIGTVSGDGKSKQGIWSNAGVLSGKPKWLVALQGAEASGISGSRWKTFTSVALSDSGVISFTATLEQGRGGVTPANDFGLWQAKPSGTSLLLREGQELVLDGVSRKVKSFVALFSEQERPTADGKVLVRVTFRDSTQALLQFSADRQPEVIAASGDAVTNVGSTPFRFFGVPALNQSGTAVFEATLVRTVANLYSLTERGVFITRDDGFDVVAWKSGIAPGVMWKGAPGKFVSFADPLLNAEGQVAFMATATGGAKGIWWSTGGTGDYLQLVASTTTAVPGVEEARFAAFKSVALPDGVLAGPVFVAKLEGKGITPANDVGLWAVDSEGVLRLIVREGDIIEGKVLRSFTFLNAVPGSSAQPRSYDAQRQLIYRAFFTDGSQSLVTVRLP